MNFLLWVGLTFSFLFFSSSLLLTLLILELMGFTIIYYVSLFMCSSFLSDYLLLILFSIFVMEGVIAITGLIILVSFSGSDYLSSFSFINF